MHRLINHLLSRAPWSQARVCAYAGHSLLVQIGPLRQHWQIGADGLLYSAPASMTPRVTLSVAAEDVPRLLRSPAQFDACVQIAGDAECARMLADLAATLRWDGEADLSVLLGDVLARRAWQGAQLLWRDARRVPDRLAHNVADFLSEERAFLTPASCAAELGTEIRVLHDALERLTQRIGTLERTPS